MPSEPNPTFTIAAVIGSLRARSFSRSVFGAAGELVPDGTVLVEASITDLPLFNQDVEAAGDPAAVTGLKDAVASADAVILFTPEYNRSIPAVTKNAVDWLSRPPRTGPIVDTPVGIVAASPGRLYEPNLERGRSVPNHARRPAAPKHCGP
jgi:chromate reductase